MKREREIQPLLFRLRYCALCTKRTEESRRIGKEVVSATEESRRIEKEVVSATEESRRNGKQKYKNT
jgi:hypothetical protein